MRKGTSLLSNIDLRDVHVYGGALALASGVSIFHFGAGLAVFGALMIYLGLRGA